MSTRAIRLLNPRRGSRRLHEPVISVRALRHVKNHRKWLFAPTWEVYGYASEAAMLKDHEANS